MKLHLVSKKEKVKFNQLASHPLQSWEWGEFKQKNGAAIERFGVYEKNVLKSPFQVSFHHLPKTKYTIGYLPKCTLLNKQAFQFLKKLGKKHKAILIKIEPNLTKNKEVFLNNGCLKGRPVFAKNTFKINLNQSEERLLKKMKQKTRYNIRVAQKHNVKVTEDNSLQAFNQYLKLTFETTKRQKFYSHNKDYHQKMWQTLHPAGIARLLKATYYNKVLAAWIVFVFNKILYYPYGASSNEHRNLMASSLMMWEAILYGKKLNCHTFDLWGCLGRNPDPKNPWFGFHRFKQGFGPDLEEFIGTFDLVISKSLYRFYTLADKLRCQYLKIKAYF